MHSIITIPSKTYLIGEYGILDNHQALIMCTEPCFTITVQEADHTTHIKNLTNNPVASWIEQNLTNCAVHFTDPHHGQGGFGASSAGFAAIWRLLNKDKPVIEVLDDFLTVQTGSGGDVLAQLTGKVSLIDKKNNQTHALSWPWPDVTCSLFRTKNKVATYKHLNKLKLQSNTLGTISAQAIKHFQDKNLSHWLHCINQFQIELEKNALSHPHTVSICQQMQRIKPTLAIKGCGALGADVVSVWHKKEHGGIIKDRMYELETDFVTSSDFITTMSIQKEKQYA